MEVFQTDARLHLLADRKGSSDGLIRVSPTHHSDVKANVDGDIYVVGSRTFGYTYHFDCLRKVDNDEVRHCYQFLKRRLGSGEIVVRGEIIEEGDEARKLCNPLTISRYIVGNCYLDEDLVLETRSPSGYYQNDSDRYTIVDLARDIAGRIGFYRDDIDRSSVFMCIYGDYLYYLNNEMNLVELMADTLEYVRTYPIVNNLIDEYYIGGTSTTNAQFLTYLMGALGSDCETPNWNGFPLSFHNINDRATLSRIFSIPDNNESSNILENLPNANYMNFCGIFDPDDELVLAFKHNHFANINYSVYTKRLLSGELENNIIMQAVYNDYPMDPVERNITINKSTYNPSGFHHIYISSYSKTDYYGDGNTNMYSLFFWWKEKINPTDPDIILSCFRFKKWVYHEIPGSPNRIIHLFIIYEKFYYCGKEDIGTFKVVFNSDDIKDIFQTYPWDPSFYMSDTFTIYGDRPDVDPSFIIDQDTARYVFWRTCKGYYSYQWQNPLPLSMALEQHRIIFCNKECTDINESFELTPHDGEDESQSRMLAPSFLSGRNIYWTRRTRLHSGTPSAKYRYYWYKYNLDTKITTQSFYYELPAGEGVLSNGIIGYAYNPYSWVSVVNPVEWDYALGGKYLENFLLFRFTEMGFYTNNAVNPYKKLLGMNTYAGDNLNPDSYDYGYSRRIWPSGLLGDTFAFILRDACEADNHGIIFDGIHGRYFFHKEEDAASYAPRVELESGINQPYVHGAMCSDLYDKVYRNTFNFDGNFYRNRLALLKGYFIDDLSPVQNTLFVSRPQLFLDCPNKELYDKCKDDTEERLTSWKIDTDLTAYDKNLPDPGVFPWPSQSVLLSCCFLNYWQAGYGLDGPKRTIISLDSLSHEFTDQQIPDWNSEERPLVLKRHFNEFYLLQYPYANNFTYHGIYGNEGLSTPTDYPYENMYIPSRRYDDILINAFNANERLVICVEENGDVILGDKQFNVWDEYSTGNDIPVVIRAEYFWKSFYGRQLFLYGGESVRFYYIGVSGDQAIVRAFGTPAGLIAKDKSNGDYPSCIPWSGTFGSGVIEGYYRDIAFHTVVASFGVDLILDNATVVGFIPGDHIDKINLNNHLGEILTNSVRIWRTGIFEGFQGYGITNHSISTDKRKLGTVRPLNDNICLENVCEEPELGHPKFDTFHVEHDLELIEDPTSPGSYDFLRYHVSPKVCEYDGNIIVVACNVGTDDDIDADVSMCSLSVFMSVGGNRFELYGTIASVVPIQRVGLSRIHNDLILTYFNNDDELLLNKVLLGPDENMQNSINIEHIATITQGKYDTAITYV